QDRRHARLVRRSHGDLRLPGPDRGRCLLAQSLGRRPPGHRGALDRRVSPPSVPGALASGPPQKHRGGRAGAMDDRIRTGPARIPPGQYATDKWPVLTYGRTPKVEPEDWELRIFGLAAQEIRIPWKRFQALPRAEVTADFHCVTRFSTLDNEWSGVATREI